MTERIPPNEWKESSNWDDIVGWDGGYILGVGYCYAQQFKTFFDKQNKHYHYFQTKWGRCGTTFLFSALRPDTIIIPVAWGNATAVCQSTAVLFRIWHDMLENLLSLKVKTMMIDFPAAWHISDLAYNINNIELTKLQIEKKRKQYYDYVIRPYESIDYFEYIDLYKYISYDSPFITENIEKSTDISLASPWHSTQDLINIIGTYFLDFINNDSHNLNILISRINKEII